MNTYATNYYVSNSGAADFDGLSPQKPRKDIQAVAALTKPGDTVFVMNGVYTNACKACSVVDIVNSGRSEAYIVFTNYLVQMKLWTKTPSKEWQPFAITIIK